MMMMMMMMTTTTMMTWEATPARRSLTMPHLKMQKMQMPRACATAPGTTRKRTTIPAYRVRQRHQTWRHGVARATPAELTTRTRTTRAQRRCCARLRKGHSA